VPAGALPPRCGNAQTAGDRVKEAIVWHVVRGDCNAVPKLLTSAESSTRAGGLSGAECRPAVQARAVVETRAACQKASST
jgi:hypothetical protein